MSCVAAAPLLLLLLLSLAPDLARSLEPCPGPCRCRGRLLDCSGAALARVPPATRRRPFSVLDFTGNALAFIPPQAWKGYPWAEKLVLQHNSLRAVKRRSLEGLLLLRHLDLSYNQIQLMEARAFENLPFLETINLEGNLITKIQSDAFRAWHRMQFLQTLILSHNPLSVIEDTWFFKLPSVTHLDLGATRVTQQTLLTLLLRTSRLETLKLSNDTACCLCQHQHITETPCRTLSFDCASVCSTSAPHCAPLAETPGLPTGAVPPRKGKSSSVLKIQPKEPLLREQRTVTLTVVLSLSSPDASAPSPQQLLSEEDNSTKELSLMLQHVQHRGWSSFIDIRRFYFLAEGLVAQLKKLRKAVSTLILKSPSTTPPAESNEGQKAPAGQGGRAAGWEQHEPDSDLTRAESTLWEAARRLNISNILPLSPAHHPNAIQQSDTADGKEDEEGAEDQEEASAPTQDSDGTTKEQKLQDSGRTAGSEGTEEELTAAEERLSPSQCFLYVLLANNGPPAASSAPEDTAAAEPSSQGRSPPTTPASTTTHGQHKEQEPLSPTAPGSSSTVGSTATRGAPFHSLLSHHLCWLVPGRALRRFMAWVAQALREDCTLPQLQPTCTSMVARTELLLTLLSERQRYPEPSELLERCVRDEDAGASHPHGWVQAREMDSKSAQTEMAKHTSGRTLALLLSTIITFFISLALLVLCRSKVCARKPAKASQGSSRCSLKRCFQELWHKRSTRSKDTEWDEDEPSPASLHLEPQWLQYVYQPLEDWQQASLAELYDGETSGEEDIFNEHGIATQVIGIH